MEQRGCSADAWMRGCAEIQQRKELHAAEREREKDRERERMRERKRERWSERGFEDALRENNGECCAVELAFALPLTLPLGRGLD